jgi:hypothetical protein
VVVHLLLWSLADSKTTLDELRAQLPALPEPSRWLSHDATERFGLVAFGELPELAEVIELIGKEPDAVEEFDAE